MADLPLSTPTEDEKRITNRLMSKARKEEPKLTLLERYRDAEQRVLMLGMAIQPELHGLQTIINVPGMAVNEPVSRQEVRGFVRTRTAVAADGKVERSEAVDHSLQEYWEYNNLASQQITSSTYTRTFGRSFVSVSTNPIKDEPALVTVESPIGMAVDVDQRNRTITAALRQYRDEDRVQHATLYLPDSTLWMIRGRNGWTVQDRDDHELGSVPLIMFVNRPWSHPLQGRSEMADVIPLTDAIARMATNLQVAGETLALPHRWAAGIAAEDFVDEAGKPIPAWESYMTALRATTNEKATFGAYPTADLNNFNNTVDKMLAWCGMQLGLPTRYMGQATVNPAAEGAIIADEIRLVRNVEKMNKVDGDGLSWTLSLTEEMTTGKKPARNSIRAVWHNPATPTYSQRADAIVKLNSGSRPLLSREGSWDELGWSEERKTRERGYLAAEAAETNDPFAASLESLMGDANGVGAR